MIANIRRRFATVVGVIRLIIGVPDYERYLARHSEAHPGCAPVSREAFMQERLSARYDRPGSRCC